MFFLYICVAQNKNLPNVFLRPPLSRVKMLKVDFCPLDEMNLWQISWQPSTFPNSKLLVTQNLSKTFYDTEKA